MSDLFAASGVALPIAVANAENVLLATAADQTVMANLPPLKSGDEAEAFLFAHVAMFDATGPLPALRGTTLQRWGHIKRVLSIAWKGTPTRERPAILSMKLPEMDKPRRQRIAKLAVALPGGVL